MASKTEIKVLFFDVFGTSVQQRTPIADELTKATEEALRTNTSTIRDDIKIKAQAMTYAEWFDFGGTWSKDIDTLTAAMKAKGYVDWHAVDAYRLSSLIKLLTKLNLVISSTTESDTARLGSLFNDAQLAKIASIWHRLPPWPDTNQGLELLNQKFITATLSNTFQENMEAIVKHSSIPFQHIFTSAQFKSFKPQAKVYRGAAEKLGVKPEECGLVAAHLGDLKGAKEAGYGLAVYVERELEEKEPKLVGTGIEDLRVGILEGGLVGAAELLGVEGASNAKADARV